MINESIDRSTVTPNRKVLLVGPAVTTNNAFYGGGMGGFVRNMQVYLSEFRPAGYKVEPCFNSVRQQNSFFRLRMVWRFSRDLLNFVRLIEGVDVVHLLGQYKTAFPREIGMALVCRILSIPLIYEVKAGQFVAWYSNSGCVSRRLCGWMIRGCGAVLCEGQRDKEFIETHFQRPTIYFPNFVPDSEVPSSTPALFQNQEMRVVFIGYCYAGKGVFELVNAAAECLRSGMPLELTLAGQEHPDFTKYADAMVARHPDLKLTRLGLVGHDVALTCLSESDVFCLASSHEGEGHSNVINEAMMMGRVIVSTRQGFLGSILDPSVAYFVEPKSSASLVSAFREIELDRDVAREKASAARRRLCDLYTSRQAFLVLETCYNRCLLSK